MIEHLGARQPSPTLPKRKEEDTRPHSFWDASIAGHRSQTERLPSRKMVPTARDQHRRTVRQPQTRRRLEWVTGHAQAGVSPGVGVRQGTCKGVHGCAPLASGDSNPRRCSVEAEKGLGQADPRSGQRLSTTRRTQLSNLQQDSHCCFLPGRTPPQRSLTRSAVETLLEATLQVPGREGDRVASGKECAHSAQLTTFSGRDGTQHHVVLSPRCPPTERGQEHTTQDSVSTDMEST